jgi:crossover junction endodeoxyribonuclease RusA
LNEFRIIMPGIPPSVNRYVRHTKSGRHYVSQEAERFKNDLGLLAKLSSVTSKLYELEVHIYLGHGERGDGDNFWKVIADGLVECGAIRSDAAVVNWLLYKHRDRKNPRTEITIRGIQ